jgi:hypothetical protein
MVRQKSTGIVSVGAVFEKACCEARARWSGLKEDVERKIAKKKLLIS